MWVNGFIGCVKLNYLKALGLFSTCQTTACMLLCALLIHNFEVISCYYYCRYQPIWSLFKLQSHYWAMWKEVKTVIPVSITEWTFDIRVFFWSKMCRILIFSAFIYISDAKLQWEDSPKHVELIEVDFGSSVSIECNLHIGEKVHSSSHIKVVTWHKNSYKKPIYR